MTPEQCRAARGLVDIAQRELARAAEVGESTVRNFEAGRSVPGIHLMRAIQAALEVRGVRFLAEGDRVQGGAGVMLITKE